MDPRLQQIVIGICLLLLAWVMAILFKEVAGAGVMCFVIILLGIVLLIDAFYPISNWFGN